jgi:peptidoglycan-associated lipoprotein
MFFAYDSSRISNAASRALLHDAAWLKAHPEHSLVIEGHCDVRGTLEYNLVLGEKRAKNVRTFLLDQQINPERLTIVSYGKERPFCRTHDEPRYQQNRRGHLLLRGSLQGS